MTESLQEIEQKKPPEEAHEHDFKCTYEGWEGERYRCACGESYWLDYEDMK